MSNKTERAKRRFKLDGVGHWQASAPLSTRELLYEGMPSDVRQCLGSIAAVMLAGRELTATEREFIGGALHAISQGIDPNEVLKVKPRKNARFKSLREMVGLHHQVTDLQRQGASVSKALEIIASYSVSGDRPHEPSDGEADTKFEQLKKAYAHARPILKRLGKIQDE